MKRSSESHEAWIQRALERYERPLVRYAARITGDVERARDVVQDSFLRLCQLPRAQVEDRLEAWLFTVCRNRALDVIRKEGRMGTLPPARAAALAHEAAGPADIAARSQAQQRLLQAVDALPAEQQRVFRLKFGQHKTYREISRETGRSLGTVSNLMAAAMRSLRQQLRGHVDLAGEV